MPEQSERATAEQAEKQATGGRRLELSIAQVTASALAAVVGAVLASQLGVYGTIAGAAVVSIGATTGGAVFQHLFRRTGEQLREATDRGPGRALNGLQQAPPPSETAPLPAAWLPEGPPAAETSVTAAAGWNDSPVFRARRRWSWKTLAAVSGLVFALAMTPILVVELASGKTLNDITTGQDVGGTSIFPGGKGAEPAPPVRPGSGRSATPGTGGDASGSPSRGASGASAGPSSTPSGSAGPSPTNSPSPSNSPGATPSPTPTPTPAPTPTPTPSSAVPSSAPPLTPSTAAATPATGAAAPPTASP